MLFRCTATRVIIKFFSLFLLYFFVFLRFELWFPVPLLLFVASLCYNQIFLLFFSLFFYLSRFFSDSSVITSLWRLSYAAPHLVMNRYFSRVIFSFPVGSSLMIILRRLSFVTPFFCSVTPCYNQILLTFSPFSSRFLQIRVMINLWRVLFLS